MQLKTPAGIGSGAKSSAVGASQPVSGKTVLREVRYFIVVAGLAFGLAGALVFLLSLINGEPVAEALNKAFPAAVLSSVALGTVHVVSRVRRARRGAAGGGEEDESAAEQWLFGMFLVLALVAIWFGVNWMRGDRPSSSGGVHEAKFSYGPEDAQNIDLIIAPGISAELLPSAESLGKRRFEQFDISAEGSITVVDDGHVYDMASGVELFADSPGVRAIAFVNNALTAANDQGALGYDNGSRFEKATDTPWAETGLAPSTNRTSLFIYRESVDEESGGTAIYSLSAGGMPEPVAASKRAVFAVAGDASTIFYSNGARIFRVAAGESERLIELPNRELILGLAASRGSVYFATQRAVYALNENIAVPLVIGIGGPIRLYGSDLYVLAHGPGRLFRLHLSNGD